MSVERTWTVTGEADQTKKLVITYDKCVERFALNINGAWILFTMDEMASLYEAIDEAINS